MTYGQERFAVERNVPDFDFGNPNTITPTYTGNTGRNE